MVLLAADDQHPEQISHRLMAQRNQHAMSQLKLAFLQRILTLAMNKTPAELPTFLRTAAHTPIARWQSGWRFVCCLWRPKPKTQAFLLQLANAVERATPLDHALTLQNYRHTHFCLTNATSIFLDYANATTAREIIFLRHS